MDAFLFIYIKKHIILKRWNQLIGIEIVSWTSLELRYKVLRYTNGIRFVPAVPPNYPVQQQQQPLVVNSSSTSTTTPSASTSTASTSSAHHHHPLPNQHHHHHVHHSNTNSPSQQHQQQQQQSPNLQSQSQPHSNTHHHHHSRTQLPPAINSTSTSNSTPITNFTGPGSNSAGGFKHEGSLAGPGSNNYPGEFSAFGNNSAGIAGGNNVASNGTTGVPIASTSYGYSPYPNDQGSRMDSVNQQHQIQSQQQQQQQIQQIHQQQQQQSVHQSQQQQQIIQAQQQQQQQIQNQNQNQQQQIPSTSHQSMIPMIPRIPLADRDIFMLYVSLWLYSFLSFSINFFIFSINHFSSHQPLLTFSIFHIVIDHYHLKIYHIIMIQNLHLIQKHQRH